jgi:hypothetical protein
MLVIRTQQIAALLRRPDEGDFEERLLQALAERYPEEVAALGPDQTQGLVHHAIATGLAHGLDGEVAIATLAMLMVQLGRGFERSPDRARALARLHHPTLPPSLKIQLVEQALTARTHGRVVVRATGRAS